MSDNASAGAESTETTVADYDDMLATLDVAIDEAQRKIERGRIRKPEYEKVRCKQWKTLGYLINVRRQVANDRDLEELAEEIEQIKANQQASTNGAGMVTGGSR